MCSSDLTPEVQAVTGSVMTWQRTAFWPVPLGHLLLTAAGIRPTSGSKVADCLLDLSSSSLAWMHDHQVQGRVLLPAAALFELTSAASAACLLDSSGISGVMGLQGLSILAPCMLPGTGGTAAGSSLLQCGVNGRTGAIEVIGGRGSKHLVGAAAQARTPAGAQGPQPTGGHPSAALLSALAGLTQAKQGHNFATVGCSKQSAAG